MLIAQLVGHWVVNRKETSITGSNPARARCFLLPLYMSLYIKTTMKLIGNFTSLERKFKLEYKIISHLCEVSMWRNG